MYYPDGFDRRKAIQLAELIVYAYDQLEACKKGTPWKLPGDYVLVEEINYFGRQESLKKGAADQFDHELRTLGKSEVQKGKGLPIGFIARRKSDVYLVFRGTMTASEWLRDLSMHLTPYPYVALGKVHDGFVQTYEIFRKAINDGLNRIGTRGRLFIAGHSLGGALATIAAPDISAHTPFRLPSVYTFASPRVGDRIFAAEYNKQFKGKSFRIVNTCDVVPSMPLPVPFLKLIGGFFTHVETPIDFTTQEEDIEKNHLIVTYLRALEAGAERGGLMSRIFK